MDSLPRQMTGNGESVFLGDGLLELAQSGAFVLDPERADGLIGDLEVALDLVRARISVNEMFVAQPRLSLDGFAPEVADAVAGAVFVEQVAPGRMEASLEELPKCIQALQLAKQSWRQ